ncbi:MAG: HD domain-containing protein [Tepidisphaeraceae bacterium]
MASDRRVAHPRQTFQHAREYALRQLGIIDHERRVVAIASRLFDLTVGLHDLARSHRRLLRLACVLHDVGRRYGEPNHPFDGARMIARDRSIPLSPSQRRQIAYLTRYHRGAVPEAGYDDILRPGDQRKSMRLVLAFLRAADTLDRRAVAPPALAISLKGRRVQITCGLEHDTPRLRRMFKRRKKFHLLEELLDCRVEVQVRQLV